MAHQNRSVPDHTALWSTCGCTINVPQHVPFHLHTNPPVSSNHSPSCCRKPDHSPDPYSAESTRMNLHITALYSSQDAGWSIILYWPVVLHLPVPVYNLPRVEVREEVH